MGEPKFLWDRLLRLFFGILALIVLVVFWVGAVVFTIGNVAVAWHRLWRYFGVWNLVAFRFIMRMRNLYDTSRLVLAGRLDPRQQPPLPWDPSYHCQRTVDGSFNDIGSPSMGRVGTPFGRNVPPNRLRRPNPEDIIGEHGSPGNPTPREVSRVLLTRDRFRPATSLNVLAAAWIQFQVHDWFNHKRQHQSLGIRLKEGDSWPDARQGCMHIRRNEEVADHEKVSAEEFRKADFPTDLPIYANMESHWWDGSQIYGNTQRRQDIVRDRAGRLGKLKISPDGRLPPERDPDLQGIDLTGSNENWWVGLSLLHTLFAREHNAICDALHQGYPEWDDERLFQTARLINTMLMAKIHTIEWTPAILGHPTLLIGMRSNWYGILGRFNKFLGRSKFLTGIQEELTGIPGSAADHHATPYCMTEEFAAVYRLHPLIPDDYRFYSSRTDELLEERTFTQIQGHHTRPLMDALSMEDLFYSFGTAHPGAVTLHNFPRTLQEFTRIKDPDGPVLNEPLDLGAIDVFRDRERAVPRYNFFRRLLFRLPETSYKRLVGLPFIWSSMSRLSPRERKERQQWVQELRDLYGPNNIFKQIAHYFGRGPAQGIDRLDTMIGLTAESPPKGFGFSDTAFRIFVLMASRRLKSDRFFTDGYKPEVYTELGMRWIEENGLKSVIQRHYPALCAALVNVENPFAPWQRIQHPSPEPSPVYPFAFTILPIIGGIVTGALVGWLVQFFSITCSDVGFLAAVLDAAVSWRTLGGMVLGFCVGAMCQVVIHLTDNLLAQKFTLGGLVAIVNFAVVGGTLYGRFLAAASETDTPVTDTFLGRFATGTTLRWAAIGGGIGLALVGAVRMCQALKVHAFYQNLLRPALKALPRMSLFGILGAIAGWGVGWLLLVPHEPLGVLIGALAGALVAVPRLRRIPIGLGVGAAIGWFLGVIMSLLGNSAMTASGAVHTVVDSTLQWCVLVPAFIIALAVSLDRGLLAAIPGFVTGWVGMLILVVVGRGLSDLSGRGGLIGAVTSLEAVKGTLTGALLGALLTLFVWQVRWRLRRGFWDLLAYLKFKTNKPLVIDAKRSSEERIEEDSLPRSFGLKDPAAGALANIPAAKQIPRDEKCFGKTRYLLKQVTFPFQRWAYHRLSPMQEKVPPIHADPRIALDHAYRGFRRRRYDAPVLPPEFEGSPDLGSLAVRGPYACYLQQNDINNTWEWDLTCLSAYEYCDGLHPLDVRVTFELDHGRLRERSIMTREIGACLPGDRGWQFAKKLALCALSNHMSLVRHWNWVHVTPAASFAIATRNHLDADHPIARLLWPHVFGTIQSNKFGNMAQLSEGGDFEGIFAFTRRGLYDLLRDTHREFNFEVTDPYRDAVSRGIHHGFFGTPTQDNMQLLFDEFLAHTIRYVNLYYRPGPLLAMLNGGAGSPQMRREIEALDGWLATLNRLIPGGTGYQPNTFTRDDLSRLLARFIYLVTALHEMVGSALWNYQLWTHRQPVRLYKDGRREPRDVYQRLVNFNYMLNVNRTPLVADYSDLALPGPQEELAKKVFRDFKKGLEDCERRLRTEPWAVWKVYPSDLEAHINA